MSQNGRHGFRETNGRDLRLRWLTVELRSVVSTDWVACRLECHIREEPKGKGGRTRNG